VKNPITGVEYETEQELIDSLAESYQKLKKDAFDLAQDEADILKVLDELAGQPKVTRGKIKLEGVQSVIRVERRENVSYPRDRGVEHPLRHLLTTFQAILAPMIAVEYKESGSAIEKLLQRAEHPGACSEFEQSLADALRSVREVKPGKIGVEVKSKSK
jgi:hypothetical protein